ncbi:SepM family pheromone-processing serine protease [Enterococcus asini]|uniref:SepM family pheromone-processing serine protease n=1 Tax=Enterococcus asini TaxID=57732 RepID=UPI00288E0E54|nr:SepM family pheromone-processing serine protease [Enterococcus asini]MDT2762996.1 SepM family pheromone-processing serine protease [Enterococcus asini]
MKNKFSVKRLLLLLAALVAIACVIVPIPYYVEGPGATIDLSELITVNGKEDDFPGSFSLTSVGIRQATVLTAAKAKFSDFEEVVSKEALMGGATTEEYDQMQAYYMESSQNAAIEQALKLAGKPYEMSYLGVYVMSVEPNSTFYGKIAVGDTVTKVNGKSFASADELVAYVHGQTVGDTVTVTYLHDGKEKEASGKLIALPKPNEGKAGIGISLTSHTEIKTAESIKFDVDNIGGPSAGLMFTLEIYQQLVGKDLRKGLDIAGTGTMEADGTVGQIGGIDKKVASASESGAKVFFAPKGSSKEDTNYKEAKAAAKKLGTDMKIVPVGTLADAVAYLEQMN